MPIQGAGVPNNVSKTLICVDKYENAEIMGRIFNPYLPEHTAFSSISDMLSKMDALYNALSFPQASVNFRSFLRRSRRGGERAREKPAELRRYYEDEALENEAGVCASFLVLVRFRQNATWQGSMLWREANMEHHFSSTLELVRLMGGAIDTAGGGRWDVWTKQEETL